MIGKEDRWKILFWVGLTVVVVATLAGLLLFYNPFDNSADDQLRVELNEYCILLNALDLPPTDEQVEGCQSWSADLSLSPVRHCTDSNSPIGCFFNARIEPPDYD